MVEYKLSSVPNQMFNTNINGSNFEFTFRSFRGIVYINVSTIHIRNMTSLTASLADLSSLRLENDDGQIVLE